MNKVRIELNHEGMRELLRSPAMLAVCEEYANRARSRLGEGYSVNSRIGTGRANAEVMAETFKARRDNLKNNSILKALRGG